jgi:hypothetical protein
MLRVINRVLSAILGIAVAAAGFGIFAYLFPRPAEWHWANFVKADTSLWLSVVNLVLVAAFATIIFGAFVMSYRMLWFAITGRKPSKARAKPA